MKPLPQWAEVQSQGGDIEKINRIIFLIDHIIVNNVIKTSNFKKILCKWFSYIKKKNHEKAVFVVSKCSDRLVNSKVITDWLGKNNNTW